MTINEAKSLIDLILQSGERIKNRQGKIKDIGINKKDLTEEDIKIEQDLKAVSKRISPNSTFFAEEENGMFKSAKEIWVVDPISGTHLFINNLPHYAISAAHLTNNKVDFAVVYDPSQDDLFFADNNSGAFYNGKRLKYTTPRTKSLLMTRYSSKVQSKLNEIVKLLPSDYIAKTIFNSFALNYCHVALGKHRGLISISKDSFPEFAGGFIAQQAGLNFTNINNEKHIRPGDRIFICGGDDHNIFLDATRKVVN